MDSMVSKIAYIQEYYERNYADGGLDQETTIVAEFLIEKVKGVVLDCGCWPVPQVWSICMPQATEIHAIDLPDESIDFVKEKIATVWQWAHTFSAYQKIVEKKCGPVPEDYIQQQVHKIKSLQQADMTKKLPFKNNFFDTILSLYSLGVLQNADELEQAIIHIKRCLKPQGKLLHINTSGKNSNIIVPEYTRRGLEQTTNLLEELLKKHGFSNITTKHIHIDQKVDVMYTYDTVFLLSTTNHW